MKMTAFLAFLTVFSLGAGSAPAKDGEPARKAGPPAAGARKNGIQLAAAPAEEKKAPAPKKEAPREQEQEEGGVMIDSRTDADPGEEPEYRPRSQGEPDDANIPGGMPVSYGLLKGTLAEDGRSILVFENEDGAITFVQVLFGKNSVSWKLISRIRRSMD